VGELITGYDKMVQQRFAAVEADIHELDNRASGTDRELKAMREDIQKLQRGLCVAESAPAEVRTALALEAFEREPIGAMLRISATSLASRAAVLEACTGWLADAGVPVGEFTIAGAELGKTWRIEFKGADGLGTRRARKAQQMLRREDGSWLDPHANGPDGRVRLYISEDKSPKQVRTELLGKKLLSAVQLVHPGKPAKLLRRTGAVTVAWKAGCKVCVDGPEEPAIIMWNYAATAALDMDRDAIVAAFAADAGAGPAVQ
jgi:hypothetical protein